jgi:peroxiredoxin
MLKRILLFTSLAVLPLALALPVALPGPRAQGKKPSQALRQVGEQQKKLLQEFQRKTEQIMERSAAGSKTSASGGGDSIPFVELEPEEVDEAVIKFAERLASEFETNKWTGDELFALASLYQAAEQFAPAAEAFRAYLKSNSKSKLGANARSGLIRSLIETEQLADAWKLLEGTEWDFADNQIVRVFRTGLYKDLAAILLSRGQYAEAAMIANKGFTLTHVLSAGGNLYPFQRETAVRNQVALGSIAVAASERIGQKRKAEEVNRLIMEVDAEQRPELRLIYESELAAARLVGTSAPELDVLRWVEQKDGGPRSLGELRGKVVLLDFNAMWCWPCAAAFPRQRQFLSKYASKGFEILGVTKLYGRSDREESLSRDQEIKSLQAYKARHQISYPIAVGKMDDVTNEERYRVTGIPTMILIDRSGRVRYVKRGVGEYRNLEKQIEKLVAEK